MRDNIVRATKLLAQHLFPDTPVTVDGNMRLWLGEPKRLQGFNLSTYINRVKTTLAPLELLVRGKRVCLVGGGPLEEGVGEDIDSFDVVIRCNNGYRATRQAPERCGSRTDAIYHCCGTGEPEDWPHPGDWPRVPIVLAADAERNPHKLAQVYLQSMKQGMRQVAIMPKAFFIRYGRTRGLVAPHTGMIAMLHLCELAAEVHTRGITFFADGYDPAYKDWDPIRAAAYACRAHRIEEQRKWLAAHRPSNLFLCAAGEQALALPVLHIPTDDCPLPAGDAEDEQPPYATS